MKRHITLLCIWSTVTAATLWAKTTRDEELARYLKFACETGPRGCTDNVRGCYTKITFELERCEALKRKGKKINAECAEALDEYEPLNKLGRVMHCAEYFVRYTTHDRD